MKREDIIKMIEQAVNAQPEKDANGEYKDREIIVYDPISITGSCVNYEERKIGRAFVSDLYDGSYYYEWYDEDDCPQSAWDCESSDRGIVDIDDLSYDDLAYLYWAIMLSTKKD